MEQVFNYSLLSLPYRMCVVFVFFSFLILLIHIDLFLAQNLKIPEGNIRIEHSHEPIY